MERATKAYQESLPMADSYLAERGIAREQAEAMRLGVVLSPEPGHEIFANRLTIPYMDMLGVCGIKFRCLTPHDCKEENCKKYLTLEGMDVGLYNITDADSPRDTIHIAEGELDTLILKQVFPEDPVVGVAGVDLWKPHHRMHFQGFERVLIWADGDQAGKGLARKIREQVEGAERMPVPWGMDVTELYVAEGPEALRALADLEEDD